MDTISSSMISKKSENGEKTEENVDTIEDKYKNQANEESKSQIEMDETEEHVDTIEDENKIQPEEESKSQIENDETEENVDTIENENKTQPNANENEESKSQMEEGSIHDDDDNPTDAYHYLKKGEFSSEMFKVCVKNIPKRISYGCFRSAMKSALGFKPRKVKYNVHTAFAFLAFSNEEEREKAIIKLDGYVWKGTVLACVKALPAKDPFVQNKRKRKLQQEQTKRQKLTDSGNEEEIKPPEDKIVEVVCPYASIPYEEQLSLKEQDMKSCIERLTYQLKEVAGNTSPYSTDLCLNLLPIIKSPALFNYRNKVEFGIGKGADKKDNVIGFRLASYREGSLTIVEPTKCINISTTSIEIAKEFQQFIQTLPYPSYNALTHIGFWQQLTIRTCSTDDVMVMIQVQSSHLSSEDFQSVLQQIKEFFTSSERTIKVTSIFITSSSQGNSCVDTFEHLAGEKYIKEMLLGLQFRISPDAFFQVNTPAAEILYKTIREWCETDEEDTCVLDVCCGTGTIGLCIANGTSHQVTGIEMSQQAIEDAKYNAKLNDIENADFICGQAEDVIGKTMKNITATNIIAVIDPPRAGLRRCVAEILRSCSAIKRIIYVSCSPKQAIVNFLWFCRPESKRFKGEPFRTIRAVPIDLFPHTRHCELIVELARN